MQSDIIIWQIPNNKIVHTNNIMSILLQVYIDSEWPEAYTEAPGIFYLHR